MDENKMEMIGKENVVSWVCITIMFVSVMAALAFGKTDI